MLPGLSEVSNIDNRVRRPTVCWHGELVVVFTSLLSLPPMLGYVVLGIDHLAIDIYTWVCIGLQGLRELMKKLELGLYLWHCLDDLIYKPLGIGLLDLS